jgi:NAD(P)H-hydrate epimerase
MIPLYSTATIRSVDEYAINKLKIPSIVLMENAAIGIFNYAHALIKLKNLSRRVGLICGKGNNGGDGFAVARHFLNNDYKVKVIYLFYENEMTNDAKINFHILRRLTFSSNEIKLIKYRTLSDLKHLNDCSIICDAMLGSGIQGELKEPYKSIINKVNTAKQFKLSIDIPTGLNADTGYSDLMFNSNLTVTLGELKTGLFFGDGYANAGTVKKANIGISPSFYPHEKAEDYLIEAKDAFDAIPRKRKSIHKYSAGKVLTIAGSKNYSGAAVLTAKSSLKVGAGASVLCFPKSIRNFVHKNLGEVVLQEYDDNGDEFLKPNNIRELNDRIKWADVVALGPGLGRNIETQQAIIQILKERNFSKIVIDADGLFPLNNKKFKKIDLSECILTPHHGEFCSLIGIQLEEFRKDILEYGRKFVKETSSYLVLKGAPTVTFMPNGKVVVNNTGNPGMAKFGTGDVLTGVIAGFLAQSREIKNTLTSAVYVHSLTADLLVDKFTELGFTATDLMNNIPSAIRYLRNSFV